MSGRWLKLIRTGEGATLSSEKRDGHTTAGRYCGGPNKPGDVPVYKSDGLYMQKQRKGPIHEFSLLWTGRPLIRNVHYEYLD